LRSGCLTLTERCVRGITANREHLRRGVERSIGIVTALNPYIGYTNATEIAREALKTDQSVYDLVLEKKLLTREQLDEILQPEVLTTPHVFGTATATAETHALSVRRDQTD
jgi:aspartate ammonia-lyase